MVQSIQKSVKKIAAKCMAVLMAHSEIPTPLISIVRSFFPRYFSLFFLASFKGCVTVILYTWREGVLGWQLREKGSYMQKDRRKEKQTDRKRERQKE